LACFPRHTAGRPGLRPDRNGQYIKGFSVFRLQSAILPTAVRKYRIEQLSFFRWRLILEQKMCSLGEFEHFDAFLDIAPICVLVGFDVAHDPALVATEFGRLLIEEFIADAPIQLVHVHRIDPPLQTPMFVL
jgi:hypothetical protein